jgi:uncharacterized alkaline shock family protein YloU
MGVGADAAADSGTAADSGIRKDTSSKQVIIAPGVAETIVALAVSQLDGVASVGNRNVAGMLGSITKKHAVSGVLILEDEGEIKVEVNIQVFYGFQLQELAEQIRAAVADALFSQACIEIASVDISIDGIVFSG